MLVQSRVPGADRATSPAQSRGAAYVRRGPPAGWAGPVVGRVRVPHDAAGSVVYAVTDLACRPTVPGQAPVAGDDAADAAFVDRAQLRALQCTPGLVDTLTAWGVLPR